MDAVWIAYGRELAQVNRFFRRNFTTRVPLLQEIADHIANGGGKRLRPLLLILTTRLCGSSRPAAIVAAAAVEFIHTATLLHDDVLDGADLRRGKKAVRAIWGNHASILMGDYLYSLAVRMAVELKNQEVNKTLSETCKRMVEGEALQLSRNGDIRVSEADYLRIIRNKTAALIEASCRLGGIVSGASPATMRAIGRFGSHLGVAFQVADDTLDYSARNETIGKSRGRDLLEGKVTLPLLHLLEHCRPAERVRINRIFKANGSRQPAGSATDEVVAMMHRYGSLDYTLSRAGAFVERAKAELAPFPDSPAKRALCVVADYVIARDH